MGFAVVSSYTSQVSCPPRTQEVSPILDTVTATELAKSKAQLEAEVASCFSSRGFKGSYVRSVGGGVTSCFHHDKWKLMWVSCNFMN